MEYYGGRGFRSSLDEVLRAWEEGRSDSHENSSDGASNSAVVAVNYANFKTQLRKFSHRRTKLRRLIDNSDDSIALISEQVKAILHPPDATQSQGGHHKLSNATHNHTPTTALPSPEGCYLPMSDDYDYLDDYLDEAEGMETEGCQLPGIVPHKRKRSLYRRGVFRKVSSLEREEVAVFLAHETVQISEFYRARLRVLRGQLAAWKTKLWLERDKYHLKKKSATRRSGSQDTAQTNNNNNNNDGNTNSDQDPDASSVRRAMLQQTLELGRALLDLEAVCVLNVLVVHQTLIRYDDFARSFEGTPLMEFYLKTVLRSTTPHAGGGETAATTTTTTPNLYHHELRQILLHPEIADLSLEFARHLDWLVDQEDTQQQEDESGTLRDETSSTPSPWTGMEFVLQTVADRFQKDRKILGSLLRSTGVDDKTVALATTESPNVAAAAAQAPSTTKNSSTTTTTTTLAERFMDMVGKHLFLGINMEDQFFWYLDGTLKRGRSLTEELRSLTEWKRQSRRFWSLPPASPRGRQEEWLVSNHPEDGSGAGNSEHATTWGAAQALLEGLDYETLLPRCGEIKLNCFDDEGDKGGNPTDEMVAAKGEHSDDDTNGVSKQQKFNLFMALAGGFLYCMNYYIVEPSSTMYVNALGAHDAAGATLIGMMPIASFLAAIVYSIWTNTAFRQPFLVSCSLMVTGNLIYSAAYNYKSLPMALVGRFLTGLGGPKMIVRRYMADTTSVNIRTSVNAGFGMVVAAGSALGPGCAILLSHVEFSIPLVGGSALWFNSMTGPGWFMATLWSFFSVALYYGFQEQERIGLTEKLEQDRMERQNITFRQDNDNSSVRIEEGIVQDIPQDGSAPPKSPPVPDGDGNANVRYSMATPPPPSSQVMYTMATASPSSSQLKENMSVGEESMKSILTAKSSVSMMSECYHETMPRMQRKKSLWVELQDVRRHFLFPVRICMGLLFAKVFVIETLVSCTSVLSKRRYGWTIRQVGMLGCANGFFVIPLSILVGKLSLRYQDRYLMVWLLSVGMAGLCLLVDVTDLIDTSVAYRTYNERWALSVGPIRYVMGYFVTYVSIQSFEGIIGSALSKLIPSELAQGTFNSGLLATLVDTLGRSCGDLFISLMGFWNIRQLMNLLFIPGVMILATCLAMVRKYYDLLAV